MRKRSHERCTQTLIFSVICGNLTGTMRQTQARETQARLQEKRYTKGNM